MKVFISQTGAKKIISTIPVKVNKAKVEKQEMTEEEFENLIKVEKPIDPKEEQRKTLKTKIENGTATDADIKEALKLLL